VDVLNTVSFFLKDKLYFRVDLSKMVHFTDCVGTC